MITSKEIVFKALEFDYPERVAHSFPPSDFISAEISIPTPKGEWTKMDGQRWQRIDEWGIFGKGLIIKKGEDV